MVKSRNILPPKRFWLQWEEQLLRDHYADALTADLAKVLGCSATRVLAKANAMGLKKLPALLSETARERTSRLGHGGMAYRFKPGQVPHNKGLRRPGFCPGDMAKTQFKPGQRPHTWLPVGSFRVTVDGTLEQKFSDTPGPPKARWRAYSALVWEAAHGPVPKGQVVVFKPGQHTTDPALVTIDRIECVPRAELMRRNSLRTNYPTELANLILLRGTLNRQINRRAKEITP